MKRLVLWFIIIYGFWITEPYAQLYHHEDEVKISNEMQNQLQKELERVFGKNKASALVRVELMIDPEIRDAIKKSFLGTTHLGPESKGAQSKLTPTQPKVGVSTEPVKPKSEFLWKSDRIEGGTFVLPGFQAKRRAAKAETETGTAPPSLPAEQTEKVMEKPDTKLVLATGTRIRRISVRVSVDRKLPPDALPTARSITSTFLSLNPGRGDVVNVGVVSMPSVWQRIFGNPDILHSWLKKTAVTFLILIGLATLLFLFFSLKKMFEKFVEQVIGFISQRAHKLKEEEEKIADEIEESELTQIAAASELPPPTLPPPPETLLIDIPPEKVDKLYHLLQRESAENVAIVLHYVSEKTRSAFLELLSEEKSVEILAALAQMQLIEPEKVEQLKFEIETRIKNMVGGAEKVVELIQNSEPSSRKELLNLLKEQKEELYQQVRSKIFLIEDLLLLEDSEWQILLQNFRMSDLAIVFSQNDASSSETRKKLVNRVKKNLSQNANQILEETISFQTQTTEEQIMESQENILAELKRLVQEHKISNPIKKRKKEIEFN